MSGSTEVVAGTWSQGRRTPESADVRGLAVWVVERSLARSEPTAPLVERVGRGLAPRDRALLRRLVDGVLRWLLRLDDVVGTLSGRPVGRIDPRLLGPLRLGAFQLLFLDRIPPHAAVHGAVELAKRRSAAGSRFVNAVLRKVAARGRLESIPVERADALDRLAIETSHPRWMIERWVDRFGETATRNLLDANNRERPAAMLVLDGPAARGEALAALDEAGVVARASGLAPAGVLVEADGQRLAAEIARGTLYPQDEASQCAALVPAPRRGERILDAAAAPGGKSLSLLALEPTVRIVAADQSLRRLSRLRQNRDRSRHPFRIVATDAARPGLDGGFDRVLADLPCTGTGTLRKHPELKWRVRPAEIGRLAGRAAGILDGLAPLVRGGGLLVIATCSIEREENEDQVAAFLTRHRGFVRLDPLPDLPAGMAAGLGPGGIWRLLPGDDHDGFTVHVLHRRPQRTSR